MEPDTQFFQQQKNGISPIVFLHDSLQKIIVEPLYGKIIDYRRPRKDFPQVSPLIHSIHGFSCFF